MTFWILNARLLAASVWPYVLSQLAIALTFVAMAVCLAVFLKRRPDFSSVRIMWLVVLWLAFCSMLHFADAVTASQPASATLPTGTLTAAFAAVLGSGTLWLLKRYSRRLPGPDKIREAEMSIAAMRGELTREQDLMKTLADGIPDAIYFKDTDSRFIRCNRQAAAIYGLSSPEMAIGKTDHDFFPAEEADTYRADELRIIETGEPIINKQEYELWRDGQHHWVSSTKMPLRDKSGAIVGTFGLSRDITELKQAQQDLREKVNELQGLHAQLRREQCLFSSLIDSIPDSVFFKNDKHQFIRVNPAMAGDAGFAEPSEMYGLTDMDVWDEELAADAMADEKQIMETGEPIIGKQERIIRKSDGDPRWVVVTKLPMRNESGDIVGTFGLASDITMLKFNEDLAADAQERFELAVQGTNDGLWDWNVENGEVWYAPRFRELLGYEGSDLEQFPNVMGSFRSHLHPDDRERVLQSFDDHLQDHIPHDEEYRLRSATGEYRWFRGRGQAIWNDDDRATRMAGSIQDIDERRKAQEELRRTRLQLEQALQGGNVGMWDWNVRTGEVEVSRELQQQLGEDPSKPWTSLDDWEIRVHPDDIETARQKTIDFIEGRIPKYESSFRLRHQNGSYRWILSRGNLFRDENGDPIRFIGVHVDVTEQRQAQAALKESEARFRGIFNQTFQFIGLLTTEGTIIDANRTAMSASGVKPEDVVGKPFWDTVWWQHSPELQQRLKTAIRAAANGEFDRFEATHPAADGSTIFVDFSVKPARDDDGNIVYLIPEGRDVTVLKQVQADLEARSLELQRSNEELEQFAYVASHDLQEPLRAIVGYCQLLQTTSSDRLDDEGRMFVESIVDGGKRMQRLIVDLLEFSRIRRKGSPFATVDLNQAVREAQALLSSVIQESGAVIEVETMPEVFADFGQIIRLFQNLISNAIKYRSQQPPNLSIRSSSDVGSGLLTVSVSDNGIGIDPEFFEQVFVIFRRLHTREAYPGTGIGLAVCKRIVERHGGTIWLDSVPGEGTTVYFTLPLSSQVTND
ncbi:MAG: PAS domain S-box protein [Planctomycetaceae bacterium]